MSPIGFSGSGIWLIKRPGFWISEERGARFGIADINAGREGGGGFEGFERTPFGGQ